MPLGGTRGGYVGKNLGGREGKLTWAFVPTGESVDVKGKKGRNGAGNNTELGTVTCT